MCTTPCRSQPPGAKALTRPSPFFTTKPQTVTPEPCHPHNLEPLNPHPLEPCHLPSKPTLKTHLARPGRQGTSRHDCAPVHAAKASLSVEKVPAHASEVCAAGPRPVPRVFEVGAGAAGSTVADIHGDAVQGTLQASQGTDKAGCRQTGYRQTGRAQQGIGKAGYRQTGYRKGRVQADRVKARQASDQAKAGVEVGRLSPSPCANVSPPTRHRAHAQTGHITDTPGDERRVPAVRSARQAASHRPPHPPKTHTRRAGWSLLLSEP